MLQYTAKRFGYMILTLWVIITLTFIAMHAIPGDPFLNPRLTPAIRANLLAKYGLDKPLHEQYLIYFKNLFQGDMGISMQSRTRSVNDLIKDHFPVSAQLGTGAMMYSVVGGLALGIIAALRRNKAADYGAMVIAVIGISVPSFVLGTMLQYLFGVQWKKWTGASLFPVAGWDTWRHMILPCFVMGLAILATMARFMRSSMLDVLSQDYIKTAKAKGLSGTEIVWKHAVRNAMLPIITILGPAFINAITGSLLIESIFNIPGLGKYFASSVTNSDYTVILGTTIFYSVLLVVGIFFVDLAYGVVDPRIRLVRGKG